MRYILLFVALAVGLAGCSGGNSVEVTRLVEVPVEVTRVVEVTRLVEVTPVPQDTPDDDRAVLADCGNFGKELSDLVSRWDDAVEVATNTPRVSLSDHIVRMQEVRRDARALEDGGCAAELEIKPRLLSMMDSGIDLFTTFMGESGDDHLQPSDFRRADYKIALDLFVDAQAALESGETTLPRRIHYYAVGETGFSIEYIDETGALVDVEASYDRVGFDEMPWVGTAIIPEGERAAVRLHNLTYPEKEVTCLILVNGVEVATVTGSETVTCEIEG